MTPRSRPPRTGDAARSETHPRASTTDPSARRPPPARTVLVTEDEPDNRENLRQILEEQGYSVRGVADGQEALDSLREGPLPDLVLLDLIMRAVRKNC